MLYIKALDRDQVQHIYENVVIVFSRARELGNCKIERLWAKIKCVGARIYHTSLHTSTCNFWLVSKVLRRYISVAGAVLTGRECRDVGGRRQRFNGIQINTTQG